MLEVLDEIEGMDVESARVKLNSSQRKYPNLRSFLLLCANDESRFISPTKIFRMMKYYKIEDRKNMDDIGELGEYVASKAKEIKQKSIGFQSSNIEVKMSNVEFLIDTYKKLRVNSLHKNQYKILRNCFTMMEETDVKWFVRILCKLWNPHKAIMEMRI